MRATMAHKIMEQKQKDSDRRGRRLVRLFTGLA
jgi:hypothetical protein